MAIYQPFFRYFRSRRRQLAEAILPFTQARTVLDVGGLPATWGDWNLDAQVTCLNLPGTVEETDTGKVSMVFGNACDMTFEDNAFDICFSNSVIEHVGTKEDQMAFAREIRRVSRHYWVQTPNQKFFVEPHYLGAFIHWLPKPVTKRLFRWLTVVGWTSGMDQQQINQFVDDINLLTYKELRELFPNATILREKALFMTKSFIVYE